MVSWCHENFTLTRFTHAMEFFDMKKRALQNTFAQRSNVLGSGQFDAPGRHFTSNSPLGISYRINVAIWHWRRFFIASWGSTWWREAIGFGNSFKLRILEVFAPKRSCEAVRLCVCARNARWSNRSGSCDLDGILAICTDGMPVMRCNLFGLSEDLELIWEDGCCFMLLLWF